MPFLPVLVNHSSSLLLLTPVLLLSRKGLPFPDLEQRSMEQYNILLF